MIKNLRLVSDLSNHVSPKFLTGCGFSSELINNDDYIGIEVEVEGAYVNTSFPPLPGWSKVEDDSLRNGVEYITSPTSGGSLIEAIDAMYNTYNFPNPMHSSVRTSMHIHIDMNALTLQRHVRDFLAVAHVLEHAFLESLPEDRRNTPYSVPLSQCRGTDVYSRFKYISEGDITGHKYSMFNIMSLLSFGTIEYRGLSLDTSRSLLIDTINSLIWIKRYITMNCRHTGINWKHLRAAALKDFPLRQHIRDADFISLALLHESTNYMTTGPSPKLERLVYVCADTWSIDIGDIVEGYTYSPRKITLRYLKDKYPKLYSKDNSNAKEGTKKYNLDEWVEIGEALGAAMLDSDEFVSFTEEDL